MPVDAPASAYDVAYQAWAASFLGPPSERELGQLALDVARAAPSHEALAAAQRLAWLFGTIERAQPAFAHALGELVPSAVDSPALLVALAGTPAAELLHCAAALEAPHYARLPEVTPDSAFDAALAEVRSSAPALARLPIEHVRALGARGRLYDARIWVGVPGAAIPAIPPAFVAWQAAHEATVAELAPAALPFAEHEHAAIVLLALRAERAGLAEPHRAWLRRLRAPVARLDALSPVTRAIVEEALER